MSKQPTLKPKKSASKDKLMKSTTSKTKASPKPSEPLKTKKTSLKGSAGVKDGKEEKKAKKNKDEPVKIIKKNTKKPKKVALVLDSEMHTEDLMSQMDQDGMEMVMGEIEDQDGAS